MNDLAGIRYRLRMGRLAAKMYSVSEETKAHYMQFEQDYKDIEYLLSKLEIAEKALGLIDGVYVPFSNRETIEVAETMKVMARKALQQMRE